MMAKKIKIPKEHIEIQKEKIKPTTYIMERRTGLLRGRLEKGDKRKKGFRYGPVGTTRVIRMKRDYKGFKSGQVIARTKKTYPRQINSVLVRVPKSMKGKIKAVTVRKHKRTRKGKRQSVRKYNRRRPRR